jgi:hypothetical protein
MDSTTSSAAYDYLVTGNMTAVKKNGTLLSGENRARGTILGKITIGAATAAAIAGGNTGNGTLTMDATTPILAKAKAGVYTVRVIRAAIAQVETTPAVPAQKGLAALTDPDGNVLQTFELSTTPGLTVANQLKFVVVEGATAFVVGDGFNITVAAGSGSLKMVDKAAVDGSAVPYAILAEDTNATSADKVCPFFLTGEFNANKLVVASGTTVAELTDALRALGIFVEAAETTSV